MIVAMILVFVLAAVPLAWGFFISHLVALVIQFQPWLPAICRVLTGKMNFNDVLSVERIWVPSMLLVLALATIADGLIIANHGHMTVLHYEIVRTSHFASWNDINALVGAMGDISSAPPSF